MTVPRLGLGVLHEPSNPPAAVVDIVFVHGLTGAPANTWLHTASGMYWPATLLSRDVPNSRILSFGYDADVVKFWNPTSQNRVGNHALNMLGGLTRLREKSDTENRKVIFVTHSLGGLVTQDCLCSSRSHPEKHLQQISSCTIGIVFLGTPHHGADLAAWAKFGSTIAKTIKHVNSDIVSVLKPGSEMLARVQDGFHGLLRLRRNEESEIAVTCFFEELPLPLVGKVVEMESAILPGYASYGIHANHMDMTKFDNKDNAGYESVLGELRRWVKGLQPALGTAPTFRVKAQKGKSETRPQDHRDDKEAELLETLASDYKCDKDSISWRDSTYSRLLWVSAAPGCGKSVLSRALIDERRVCKNPMDSTVCYFFFKDGQEQRTHSTDALSALLHQLFENTGLITYALPSYRNYGKKLRDAFSELWEILVRSARDSEVGEIVCVLDPLDECEQNARKQLTEKLVSFLSQIEPHDNPSFALKFLITSRPYDDLEQYFQPLSGVSTYLHFDGDDKSQIIGQEIDLVIDAKIPSIAGDFSDEDRKRISQRLKKMDNRTYLWLFLTIDIIAGSRSKFRKVSSIDSLLSDLPSKISDAYERILTRSSDEVQARILLHLIVAARRPLSLAEANVALTLATHEGNCTSYKKLDLWPLRSFKSTIENMCGLFVSVRDGKVSLIHQTAREFLVRNTELPELRSGKWQGCLDMATAHGTISQVCLDYLNLDDFASISQGQLDQDNGAQQGDKSYCLLDYAALNWAVHYISQDNKRAKDSWRAAQNLCNILLPQQSYWFDIYCDSVDVRSDWTSLGIASLLGLTYVAESFLDEGADINAQGGECGNALQTASERGRDEVVQMLLDKGADVNAQGGMYGNALQAASERGHDQVVRMLLDKGADVNAQGGMYGNALQAASLADHDQVVQMLLDKGADVNAQGGRYGNALQAASSRGHDQVVQMLLDKGADVNAQGGMYGNALQAASLADHDQVMLLDKGADVNARGGRYGNALQAASLRGHDEVVQMLLDKGADVNAQGGRFGNALQAASSRGDDQVVQMLLDKGADVNAQGGRRGNALQTASSRGDEEVVQMLLDEGADVNAQGGRYGNALQAASERGHDKVVRMLLNHNAVVNRKDI
ncbi:P-loop containing nucleoside triphosphate hydrolase [Lasallia pustulata]|uniref:protein S-acyltransferase n=1 Tax=Lasallia pustulata TaxID=136370 RepID=A0A1W5CUA5_9LECA|nr:P-loop containing nucleoside triphosphate hydrolase [Lasallia pustulata]